MATGTYFGTKPSSDWTANGSAESGHDFINQINEQKGNVSGKAQQYQTAQANVDQARGAYQQQVDNMKGYGDYYNTAKESEGVNQAKEQYQKDLDAVNATRRAMYVLPSATNANAETRLTQAQRDAALNNNMSRYQNLYNDNSALAQQSAGMYQTALGAAQNLAGQQMTQEQANTDRALNYLNTEMSNAQQEYNQLLQERNILRSIYGDMFDDEYNHRMYELQVWADNLQAETARYQEQQANYRAQLAKQLNPYEQYLLDKEKQADAKINQVSRPTNAITSNGEWTANGRAGVVSPQVDYVNGVKRNTYIAPNAIV